MKCKECNEEYTTVFQDFGRCDECTRKASESLGTKEPNYLIFPMRLPLIRLVSLIQETTYKAWSMAQTMMQSRRGQVSQHLSSQNISTENYSQWFAGLNTHHLCWNMHRVKFHWTYDETLWPPTEEVYGLRLRIYFYDETVGETLGVTLRFDHPLHECVEILHLKNAAKVWETPGPLDIFHVRFTNEIKQETTQTALQAQGKEDHAEPPA